jgi:hypothetical protein
MMQADGGDGSNSDLDVQAMRTFMGTAAGRADHLSKVQIEALERAEATTEIKFLRGTFKRGRRVIEHSTTSEPSAAITCRRSAAEV